VIEGRAPVLAALESVRVRRLLQAGPTLRLALAPGDRPLVVPGETVPAGGILAERVRGTALADVPDQAVRDGAAPGEWWEDDGRRLGSRRGSTAADEGELLYRRDGLWRVVAGDRSELLEAPASGIVREVRPGVAIVLDVPSTGLIGVQGAGGPARGRLDIVADPDADLRPTALDVARAGAIVVAGSRVDAEALTRARAMGVRGIVAASIATRDLRDIAASEARQRASLRPMPPFALLLLEGHLRAPIPGPVMTVLEALAGQDVAIVEDPPLLLFDPPAEPLPTAAPDLVRVRHGPAAGREGRWVGPAGRRRFAAGVHLDAGFVDLGAGEVIAVPLADLERFA
jgi:hypothetical protein